MWFPRCNRLLTGRKLSTCTNRLDLQPFQISSRYNPLISVQIPTNFHPCITGLSCMHHLFQYFWKCVFKKGKWWFIQFLVGLILFFIKRFFIGTRIFIRVCDLIICINLLKWVLFLYLSLNVILKAPNDLILFLCCS